MKSSPKITNNGIKTITCGDSVQATVNRLEHFLTSKGLTIVALVDHAAGAESIGENLLPCILILFGNPKAGTALMKKQRCVGLDLPQKVLIWEDDDDRVWMSYNDPDYLIARHHISGCDQLTSNINSLFESISIEVSQ